MPLLLFIVEREIIPRMDPWKCPLTGQIFRDPVIAEDGHTYEYQAIVQWLRENRTSPLTREPMNVNQLRRNLTLKKIIEETQSFPTEHQILFQLDVDVRKTRTVPIFQAFGKSIYEMEWMKRKGPPIILLKLDGARATREGSFYVQLSCHPHIVRTFGLIPSPLACVQLIQERAPHPDLSELLERNFFQPTEQVLWRILEQICDAMICLANNEIIHGDLACRNILVFEYHSDHPDENYVKLTDFGLTKNSSIYSLVDNSSQSNLNVIPTRYVAPEIFDNRHPSSYSEKSDVYSMSILTWEALSGGQLPYSSIHDDQQVRDRVRRGERLSRPSKCSEQLWTLINQCWHHDPECRPHFRSLKQSLVRFQFQPASRLTPSVDHSFPHRRTEDHSVHPPFQIDQVILLFSLNPYSHTMKDHRKSCQKIVFLDRLIPSLSAKSHSCHNWLMKYRGYKKTMRKKSIENSVKRSS